ncbi:MAG TPA: transcriptional repressor LexA [Nitrospiraceae bacterium]|nr:transcriptional repressor LexA [Nitrospiraceae bacterium]
MNSVDLKRVRLALGLTQEQLAQKLKTTRMTITRYESGTRRIPGIIDVVLKQLASAPRIAMVGIVAAGNPIEPVPQSEWVEAPSSMLRGRQSFALKVKGDSMRDDGILPGDIVVVHKQATARNGQTVVAVVNHEATVKKYYRKERHIELHPANASMKPIVVSPADDFRVEGVVVGVIRHCE